MMRIVSTFLASIMIIVYMLFETQTLTLLDLPCQNSVKDLILSQFVHIDFTHIVLNMLSFRVISKLELIVGNLKYLGIIGSIVGLNVFFEKLARTLFNLNCSIGFSGVLLGLVAYDTVMRQGYKLDPMTSLFLLYTALAPALYIPNLSISGHLIGILSGSIIGLGQSVFA